MSLDTDRLMNNARVRLPGATDGAIQLELFNVLNEFFQDSDIWQEEIEFAVTSADDPDTTTYYIEAESVASIHRLLSIVNSDDQTVYGTMQVPGEIILDTQPGQNDTYTATVSLTVNDPVTRDNFPEYPQWILNKYYLGLLDGLLGRMMSQPAKPFTNVQLAAYHTRKFRSTIAQASFDATHKNLANAQAWRFPQSFAVRRR